MLPEALHLYSEYCLFIPVGADFANTRGNVVAQVVAHVVAHVWHMCVFENSEILQMATRNNCSQSPSGGSQNFKKHSKTLTGIAARVFQHEYDHLNGIVFVDKISPIRKRFIKTKLNNISKGKVDTSYRTKN